MTHVSFERNDGFLNFADNQQKLVESIFKELFTSNGVSE